MLAKKSKTEEKKLLISLLNSSRITRVLEFDYIYSIHRIKEKEYYYNETLFNRYAGFSFTEKIFYKGIACIIETKLRVIEVLLIGFLDTFREDTFITDSIQEKIVSIDIVRLALVFELEKTGYRVELGEKEREALVKKIQKKEGILFGKSVSKVETEAVICFTHIKKKFERNKEHLSSGEQEDFSGFLHTFESYLQHKGYKYEKYVGPKIIRNWVSKYFFQDYGNIHFTREEYISIFRLALDILDMKHTGVYIGNFFSINTTRSNINIPDDSSYDSLPLERILRVIYHEIIGHGYTWKNQLLFFGKLKGAQYREKEEGFATILESLLWGEHIYTIDPKPFATGRIFAGEILNGEQLQYFNSLYRIITRQKTGNKTGTFLRLKKNYPLEDIGVSHIDVAYMRGMKKVQHFIATQGNPKALLSGKVSLDSIQDGNCDMSSNPNFHTPYPLSDMIIHEIYQLMGNNTGSFEEYMEKKYGKLIDIFKPVKKISPKRRELIDFLISKIHTKIISHKGK